MSGMQGDERLDKHVDPRPLAEVSASSPASDSEVAATLEKLLTATAGEPIAVLSLDRRFSAYSTSFTIDDLTVRLSDGRALELVLKDLSWHSLLGTAQKVRPRFLYNPLREIRVYERVLSKHALSTARCFGSVVDEQRARYWLFLERVDGEKLCHIGEPDAWEHAARWIAESQAATSRSMIDDTELSLLTHDAVYYAGWMERAQSFIRARLGVDEDMLRAFGRLADRYDRVTARLAALPRGLIHGELYASNILVTRSGLRVDRICPVDWETAAVGPTAMDLAALTSGGWDDDRRASLISSYRDTAATFGSVPSLAELIDAVDHCLLQLAVQWTGWARDWEAPPDQARDWAAEALRIAHRLGV